MKIAKASDALSDQSPPTPDHSRRTNHPLRRMGLVLMVAAACGADERSRRASQLGATEFLTEPVDFDHLKGQQAQLSGPPA